MQIDGVASIAYGGDAGQPPRARLRGVFSSDVPLSDSINPVCLGFNIDPG